MLLSSGSFSRKYALLLALGLISPARPAGAEESVEEPEPPRDDETANEPAELETVVIEGKLVETTTPAPNTSTTLTKEELEKFEDDDVHQVLLRVPGVQVRGEDGVGLRPNIGIRGTSPNRSSNVALMEDGLLLGPAPYSAPAAYYFPQVTRMTSVEVFKGGAQQRFGPNALGGAINLVTAEVPVGLLATADVAVGQYNYVKAHGRGGYGTERTGFLLEAIHVETDGFKALDTGGNTGFDKNEVMAKWRVQSPASADVFQRFDLKLGVSTERSNESYLGLTDADFESTPYRRYAASDLDQMKWHRGQVEAVYSVLPSDALEIRVSAYRHQFARDWLKVDSLGGASLDEILQNPNSPINRTYYGILTGQENSGGPDENLLMADNYRWFVSQGIQGQLFGFASTGPLDHEIEAGVRLHYDEANRLHTEHEYAMVGADSNSVGRPERTGTPATVTARNRGQTHALALHLVDTIEFENLTLTPGLRGEVVFTRYTDELAASTENRSTQIAVLPGMPGS